MQDILLKPFHQGCSVFQFFRYNAQDSALYQASENPSVYTKLSCYLSWIAAQYDMEYTPPGEPDPACLTDHGDITEVTAEVCRSSYSSLWDSRDGIEARCLFPFTLNGESHSSCIMREIEDFTQPVFMCPIRTVKGAGPSGTDYTDDHITYHLSYHVTGDRYGSYCPTNR